MPRAEIIDRVAELVGNDVLRVTDASSRWPALAELRVEGKHVPVALFVSRVGVTGRERDGIERRAQNPVGQPMVDPRPERDPLLLGLWESDPRLAVKRPLLVAFDAYRRLGRTTRFSMFVSVESLRTALEKGWSVGQNTSGETIRCFAPPLLGLSYAADRAGAPPDTSEMQAAIDGSGLLVADEPEIPAAAERARRAGTTLLRDARFSRRVIGAYEGRCAMCGLEIDLVQGAHIYPVSAPGSSDEPWNGIALCGNHHLAFDKHVVGVRSGSLEVLFDHRVLEQVSGSPAVRAFVDGTFSRLAVPVNRAARPRPEMFEKRYAFYADRYGWLTGR